MIFPMGTDISMPKEKGQSMKYPQLHWSAVKRWVEECESRPFYAEKKKAIDMMPVPAGVKAAAY